MHRAGEFTAQKRVLIRRRERLMKMKLLARKIRSVAVLQTEHAHLGKSLCVCGGSEFVRFVKPSQAAAFVANVRPSQCVSNEEDVR